MHSREALGGGIEPPVAAWLSRGESSVVLGAYRRMVKPTRC
jgi:hypothetical protein